MDRLKGKTAVVLGATGKDNMGQAIARRFLKEGAKVLVSGRRKRELEAFAKEIGAASHVCDITKRDEAFALGAAATKQLGRVDIAVNSTGIAIGGPFVDFSEADLDQVLDLQFKGSFFFLQSMVKAMVSGGSIIQIGSFIGQKTGTYADYEAYAGTKAGIDHIVRSIANAFGDRGLRANSISPGHTETPMVKEFTMPWDESSMIEGYPLGRFGTTADIANAAVWLASDECFMTGENLQITGGLPLRRNPLPAEVERHKQAYLAANPNFKA